MGLEKKLKPFGEIPESFQGLRDEKLYYVDKTGFIPYLIEQNRKICVFTRPRRFGKTLMLRTLQTFFEYRLDDDGKPVDNRRYFEGLKVMDAGGDVLKEMGQYPVISLSFKDVSGDTIEAVLEMLKNSLYNACQAYFEILLDHPSLIPEEQAQFRRYLGKKASEEEVISFLGDMCVWLKRITKRNVVILLDEYDVPLQKAAIYDIHHPQSSLFDQTVKLIGGFISSGFKSNSNLAYGVIAGCMRVAKESIFTGMNNPGVITVVDEIPDEFWGFTEQEVRNMLAYYGIEDKYELIEQWYDGYEYSKRKVFNPWSLLNAIRGLVNGLGENAIKPYWGLTSGNDIIDDMIDRHPEHRAALASMMNGETIRVRVYENLSYRDLQRNDNAIWSFLLYTGYLKSVHLEKDERNHLRAEMAVPNIEVWTLMDSSMQRWWDNTKLPGYDARPMVDALFNGDASGIMHEINILLDDSISVRDAKEDFYHGMMVGVLKTRCKVKSNREYGEGYPDILAILGSRAALLEIKCILPSELKNIKREEERIRIPAMMQKQLDQAEQQIRDRHYIEGLLFDEPTVSEINAYALCFCKKRCMAREVKAN
ncbi:MAG: AAA family ATPase [Proteobacteria bacterium]|nr:AAA family ATPase [Pseudomonadota bacterium]